MNKLYPHELRDRLLVMTSHSRPTPTGGRIVIWKPGPHIWGHVTPLKSADGFIPHDVGSGITSGLGVLKDRPAARYKIIIHAREETRTPERLIWYTPLGERLLRITQQPVLFQRIYHLFTTVETQEDDQ